MNQPAESWVVRQREIFQGRRHFMRDILFDKVACKVLWKLTVTGLEHIPASGPAILMMNHVTAVDPFAALGSARPRYVVPMSKIENFWNPFVGILVRSWGAYPVRRGEVDREALRTALLLLEAGEITLIAPEGTRSPALIRPKDGLAYLATRAKPAPVIVPTAVYNLETWLRDLVTPWRRTHACVSYGRGFRLRTEGGGRRISRETLSAMTDEMMYQLAALLPERNRGVYSDLDKATTNYLEFV